MFLFGLLTITLIKDIILFCSLQQNYLGHSCWIACWSGYILLVDVIRFWLIKLMLTGFTFTVTVSLSGTVTLLDFENVQYFASFFFFWSNSKTG